MARITLDDLTKMLTKAGGEGTDVPRLEGDAVDTAFGELGFDSLALLEVVGQLELTYDITLEEEATQTGGTPRELLDLVNGMLNAAA